MIYMEGGNDRIVLKGGMECILRKKGVHYSLEKIITYVTWKTILEASVMACEFIMFSGVPLNTLQVYGPARHWMNYGTMNYKLWTRNWEEDLDH